MVVVSDVFKAKTWHGRLYLDRGVVVAATPETGSRGTSGRAASSKMRDVPGAIAAASLAGLDGASELLATPLLD